MPGSGFYGCTDGDKDGTAFGKVIGDCLSDRPFLGGERKFLLLKAVFMTLETRPALHDDG